MRASDLVHGAIHVEVSGTLAAVAQDLQQEVPLVGRPRTVMLDSRQPLRAARMMREGAVAISDTGCAPSTGRLARLAREQGAKVIALTGSRQASLAGHEDAAIRLELLDDGVFLAPTTSRVVATAPMASAGVPGSRSGLTTSDPSSVQSATGRRRGADFSAARPILQGWRSKPAVAVLT